jgi:glycine cleavage system pyridoxal-binding protein P
MLFEFQTQVARLFGCAVANASMYDGSTACWEAIAMAGRVTRRSKVLLSNGLHPHYVSTARTMARFNGDTVEYSEPELTPVGDFVELAEAVDGETGCVVVQYPDILGRVGDMTALAEACHAAGRLAKVPGVTVLNDSFFNEFTITVPIESRPLVRDLADKGVLAGVSLGRLYPDGGGRENGVLVAVTETVTEEDIEALASALQEALA